MLVGEAVGDLGLEGRELGPDMLAGVAPQFASLLPVQVKPPTMIVTGTKVKCEDAECKD